MPMLETKKDYAGEDKQQFIGLDWTITENSVALFRKRTTPTERPPFVGEVSAKLCG
jgi:hypothetical protein